MEDNNLIVVKLINSAPPVFKEVKNHDSTKPWVLFGEGNTYPDYLVALLNGSAKHNAIITGKVQYITGKGIDAKKDSVNADSVNAYLDLVNPYETAEDVQYKSVMDLEVFGGFYWKFIFDRVGRLKYITHIPFAKVRTNNDCSEYYISDKWEKSTRLAARDVETVQAYNGINKGVKMYAYKLYRPKMGNEPDVYPLPDYVGAVPYINMDMEVANFHLNNLKNGFVSSTLISFHNGEPTEEAKNNIEAQFKNKFAGTNNAGRFILSFTPPNVQAPTVDTLAPSDLDKQFLELNKQIQQEIYSGHKIPSPELFGIPTEGALGDRNATDLKYELFKKTYVQTRQKAMEDNWNFALQLTGIGGEVEIKEFAPLEVVYSEQILTQILTRDELRERIGLEPIAIPVQMSADDATSKVISLFANCGKPAADYNIVSTRVRKFHNDSEAEQGENEFIRAAFSDLTEKEKQVVDILRTNPEIPLPDLAKAVKIKIDALVKMIDTLAANSIIEIDGGRINVLKPETPKAEIVVRYQYAKAPRVQGNVILPTSRDFCRQLIELDRLYTRAEINLISAQVGRDVWTERGGWYTKKGTDTATPYCRHIWQQVIAIKR
jgi:DNA-binding Lrp family transcriptional regulator